MTKSITAFIALLMIFPIANADGKIFKDAGKNDTIIMPVSEKRFSEEIDNDTIKKDTLSVEDEKKVEDINGEIAKWQDILDFWSDSKK